MISINYAAMTIDFKTPTLTVCLMVDNFEVTFLLYYQSLRISIDLYMFLHIHS